MKLDSFAIFISLFRYFIWYDNQLVTFVIINNMLHSKSKKELKNDAETIIEDGIVTN